VTIPRFLEAGYARRTVIFPHHKIPAVPPPLPSRQDTCRRHPQGRFLRRTRATETL